ARELEELFREANVSSGSALDAANAYSNIEAAIQEALVAARDAKSAAENATDMSLGLDERCGESEARSSTLLQDARGTLDTAQLKLEPQLAKAKSKVDEVQQMNNRADDGIDRIERSLQRIPYESRADEAAQAMEQSDTADQTAQDALNSIKEILLELPQQVEQARKLPKDVENSVKETAQGDNYLQKVQNIKPDIESLIDQLNIQRRELNEIGNNMRSQIEDLKEKISKARAVANR
ncbi:hypothetical protein C0J52_07674, partial [Blattella germanica]